jgi:hypothetical protein
VTWIVSDALAANFAAPKHGFESNVLTYNHIREALAT